jgi:hypothetical protein
VFQKQGNDPRPVPESSIISRPPHTNTSIPNQISNLAGLGGDLGGRALSTLLGDGLSTTLGGVLGLLGLLLGLVGGLLVLGVLDGLLAGGLTSLGADGAALLDLLKGGTDDGTLVLHNTAGTLLGNLL